MTIGDLQKLLSETHKDSPITLLNYDGTPVKITPVTTYILEIKKCPSTKTTQSASSMSIVDLTMDA